MLGAIVLGTWAWLEVGVGLQLTDHVWGLQGVTKRVGLKILL